MVALFIFYAHTIAAVTLFTKRWQETDWKEGILAVFFLALLFSVFWPMSTFVLKLFIDEKGFAKWLDRDALSLLLVGVMNSLIFYIMIKRKKKPHLAQV
jgi:ABC-type Fe3+ transport system permease subunit